LDDQTLSLAIPVSHNPRAIRGVAPSARLVLCLAVSLYWLAQSPSLAANEGKETGSTGEGTMAQSVQPQRSPKPAPRSLRLTFRVTDGTVTLVSHERVDIMCPPSVGDPPQAGKHSGFWIELRDARGRILFYELLHSPLRDSVDVHSADGKIRREFGVVKDSTFEVLLPDDADARVIALVGDSLTPAMAREARAGGSKELARFDVPKGERGGGR
jgi:hypothetical protein